MTWAEICADSQLANLPYRIETDRWGHLVMSPPPRSRHAEYQTEIAIALHLRMSGGRSIAECPIQTSEGVKAADVAWVSHQRRASKPNDPMYLVAPEICAEVESPSGSEPEWQERKKLFFEQGAEEFWVCNLEGRMRFFDHTGPIANSRPCPDFPQQISLD